MSASNILRPAIALGLALAAATASAQMQDPPARVGRIAYLAGPVSFSPAGANDWAQAPLNRPLVAGDRLWTDAGGRDEAQFGSAIARMDAGTLLTVLAADERTTQLQVSQGRIDLHVRRLAPGETVEVDTPNLAFVARQPGDYRLAVAPDGSTTDVTVLNGAGDVYGDGTSLSLAPGQGYRFGGQDLNNYVLLPPAPPDEFDRWALARDQRYERAIARRYVPQGVVGAEDLDDYGSWRTVPEYGTVWVPDRAPRNWAPYHAGHWAWIDPWGWTWIDDQPYGYAVSHYGRWVRTPDTWAWVPAPPRAQPVYAPALVAFVGTVLAFGGRSDPGVAWFPLAPYEPYRPPYHASPTYITNVNVTNTVIRQTTIVNNITNITYRNRTVPGAVVAMPAQQFAQAAPTARAGLLLPPGVARAAPVLAAPQARPLPQSRIGTPPAGRLPPAPVLQRVAVARALPAHAFVRAPGPAAVRPDARIAVHGPVPLRVLRPAIGKPVTPQPGRGPVPGVAADGRPIAQAGRPGMMPGQPGQPVHGAPPPVGRQPVALAPGVRGAQNGPEFAARGGTGAGVTAVEAGRPQPVHGPRGAAHGLLAQPSAPGAMPPGAHGPQNAPQLAARGGTGAGATAAEAGPPQPAHPGRRGPADQPRAAHGMMAQPRVPAPGPAPHPVVHEAPRPQPLVHAVSQPAPRPHPQVHAVAQAAPRPQPPAHATQQPAPRPQPPAHVAPQPAPRPQPQVHAAPQPAPRPQPPAHVAPQPAPRPQPPAPAPHPQPAPHAPAQPQPQPHPASAHGGDKGADHGHKNGEKGGH
ncbi:FecR family protein [Massilia sp. PDC64]|nr:DUF6600 domain-containing protein [Massilia sp. PDC64]SDD75576.1 FecR family protein [Massilia sp. PDC64]